MEEATELTGMLIILSMTIANTAALLSRNGHGVHAPFEAVSELRRPLLGVGLALAPVLAIVTGMLPDLNRGRPADWLAAIAFLAAALAACRPALNGVRNGGWPAWGVGGLCCLASVTVVSVGPSPSIELASLEIGLRALLLGSISLLMCALWALMNGRRSIHLAGAAGLVLVAGALLLSSGLVFIFLWSQLLALVTYFVNATAEEEWRLLRRYHYASPIPGAHRQST